MYDELERAVDIDVITWRDVTMLRAARGGPHVSIYLPTHRVWTDTPQDPPRLEHLLRVAEAHFAEADVPASQIHDLLAPAAGLVAQDDFWRYQGEGLALYLAKDFFASYRLSLAVRERVVVRDRFELQPLLRYFADDSRYYLLALSGGVRLFQGTHASFIEVDPERGPASLTAVLRRGMQAAGTEGATTAPVLQGDAVDQAAVQDAYRFFFRDVDRGLCDLLADDWAPLMLVGPAFLQELYREVNHYAYLMDEGLQGDPEAWEKDELRQRTWFLAMAYTEAARQEALHRYEGLADVAPEHVADELEAVVRAAYQHRVAVLFVPEGRHVWGRFNPIDETVEVHHAGDPDAYDLLDVAVAHTLLSGGTVHTMALHLMPGAAPAAAILRY